MRGQFPVTKQGLAEALEFLAAGLMALDVDESAASRSAVIVDELVSNLLRHDPSVGPFDLFEMAFDVAAGSVRLKLSDPGEPFDPTSFIVSGRSEIGGKGIDLIRALPREVSYRRLGGRNHLELTIDPR